MSYKKDDYLIIWSLMLIVKVVSVRQKNSVVTLYVQYGDYEFPIHSIEGNSVFTIRNDWNVSNSSQVTKLSTALIIALIAAVLLTCGIALN